MDFLKHRTKILLFISIINIIDVIVTFVGFNYKFENISFAEANTIAKRFIYMFGWGIAIPFKLFVTIGMAFIWFYLFEKYKEDNLIRKASKFSIVFLICLSALISSSFFISIFNVFF